MKLPTNDHYHNNLRIVLQGAVLAFLYLGVLDTCLAQVPGDKDFNTTCVACHTISGGRLIGPDLAGVSDRRSEAWLINFIRSSSSLIESGDEQAVALAKDYAGLLMPDAVMSDQRIKDVVSYIRLKSSDDAALEVEDSTVAETEPVASEPPSEAAVLAGQHYFQGEARLLNGGAACNACHDVRNDAVIGGGVLAAELTTAFSRMGTSGMRAILGQAPFPVMQAAYQDKPLTEEEISSLVAFLQYADSEEYNQLPRDYGIGLFLTGTTGAALLFAFFGIFWRGRKSGSVNQAIYDRQIKSVDLSG
ncbi:MAG: cytochrome c [bacterium]|nr:cytochrome c [Gammaproteobacteria bacterium]HIL98270.1 cytochrome c [Pseudomonadales bacterium]